MTLNLFLISLICVLIIDVSGFVTSVKTIISKLLTNNHFTTTQFRIKPFDCSFCMTWWVGLLYLIITSQLSLSSIAITLLFAFTTDLLYQILLLFRDMIIKLINTIYHGIE